MCEIIKALKCYHSHFFFSMCNLLTYNLVAVDLIFVVLEENFKNLTVVLNKLCPSLQRALFCERLYYYI